MGKGDRLDDLRARLEAPLADLGLDLFDVVRTGKGRGTVVQVMVDRPGGVDLETVTEATRVVSPLLDEWPGIDSVYTLEVSSPGLERPLRRPSHFAGARGMSVTIRCRDEAGVARRVRGLLVGSDEEGCTVEVDGAPQRIPFDSIEQARTVFEWGPADKPGKGSKPGRAKQETAHQ
jgi:ribosome maturation factor RimP